MVGLVFAGVVALGVLFSGGTIWDAATGAIMSWVVVSSLAWAVAHERTRRRNQREARAYIAARALGAASGREQVASGRRP